MSAANVMLSVFLLLWVAGSPQTIPPPTQTPPPKPPPTQTTPPQTQTPPPKPQTPAPKPAGTSTSSPAKPAIVDLLVTTPAGMTIPGATVKADGPVSRQGTTGADGHVVFQNMNPGTYRFRIEHDSFTTLEKEVAVAGGSRASTQAALTPGSKPPAPAPPPPAPTSTPAAPALKPGEPRVSSLTDIAEQLLRAPDPIAERALGCSGATSSRLIRVKEALAAHTHADADEVLYIVAGDATLKLGDKDQNIAPGWFAVVPRGMSHTVTKRGRNPVLILSAISGPPCQ